ncbi:MAG: winged helix-turn-helix domain-containing protein [Candidatus Binatus sp.]
MHFPDYKEVDEPLLCLLYFHGGADYAVRPSETYEPLAQHFGVTQEDQKRPRPDGYSGSQWKNHVQWARQRLINHGLLDGSTRGIWRLSPAGINLASRVASAYKALRLSN